MDTYASHLAMAALLGASVVAVSAYYMHRKTLNQLLEFAKTIETERLREDAVAEDAEGGYGSGGADSPQHLKKYAGVEKRRNHGRLKGNGSCLRGSASLPDVSAISGGIDIIEGRKNGPVHVDYIPAGLPRLHTLPEGKSGHASSTKRASHLIRPTSPKSPVASASAFESIEGSDDKDDLTDNARLHTPYLRANGNAVILGLRFI